MNDGYWEDKPMTKWEIVKTVLTGLMIAGLFWFFFMFVV